MNPQFWWFLARASGIVATALVTLSVLWGLALSNRMVGKRPTPAWVLDLHRYFGGLTFAFIGFHLLGLFADSFVEFSVVDLFVPFVGDYQPTAVAFGIISLYALIAIEVTSLAKNRLSAKAWRRVHFAGFPLFAMVHAHSFMVGTDTAHPAYLWTSIASIAAVVLLTVRRGLMARSTRQYHPTGDALAA